MNACKIFLLIISIMSEGIQNTSRSNTQEMGLNIFHKNTKVIHCTVNKIFTSLKLNRTFKEAPKIRLLLTMHKNLIKVLRNNYKKSKLENHSDNTPIKEFPKNNLVDEILKEEYALLFFLPNETVNHDFQNSTLNDSVSEQLSAHIKQFLIKIDDIISNFPKTNETPKNNNTKSYNNTLSRRSGRKTLPRDLKPWVSDAAQSFAFNRRIYRSKFTKIKKYPFMASVHITGEFTCAGSVISKDLVITAASCLQMAYLRRNTKNYPNNVSVRIGSDYSNRDGEHIPISYIYFYPKYKPESLKHNLAIMRMSKHKHFSKKNKIRRVLFDKTSHDLPSDVKRVTIVGWGAQDEMNREDSEILSFAHLDLYDVEECKAIYSNLYVTEANFCAGFISKGSGACNKDVGDPAVVAGVLVGVVSFGPPLCGTPDAPTVFTRLGLYADWIDSILKMDPSAKTEIKPYVRVSTTTLSKPIYHSELNREGVNGLGLIRVELPEEFFILKEILTDIAKSNDSGIKEVIDEGFNEEFYESIKSTTKMTFKKHPLANRSVFGIPGANFPEDKYIPKKQILQMKNPTIESFKLTTTPNIFGLNLQEHGFTDFDGDYQKLGQMIDVFYHQQVSDLPMFSKNPPTVTKKTTEHVNRWIKRKGSTLSDIVMTTPLYDGDDSSETSSGNYEGNSDSNEGMSIEVKKTSMNLYDTTAKIIFDSDDDFDDYSNEKRTTLPNTDSEHSEDYENILFVVEKKGKDKNNNKPHSNSKVINNIDRLQNKNTFGRTVMMVSDDDYTPESEDSTGTDEYVAIANKKFRYDGIANRFTKP